MKKQCYLLLFLMVLLFTNACTMGTNKAKQPVDVNIKYKQAVNDYNRTLIHVLDSGKIDDLNAVATEGEVRRMHLYLSFFNDEKKKISAKLLKLEFRSVQTHKPDSPKSTESKPPDISKKRVRNYPYVLVSTKEVWEQEIHDLISNAVLEGPYQMHYEATYELVQLNDKWVVNDVEFQEKKN